MVDGFPYLRYVEMRSDDLLKHHFIIVNNPRLEFENSSGMVASFLARRLKHNSVGSHEFIEDWSILDARIESILQERRDGLEFIVIVDILNPVCDMDMVSEMTDVLKRTKAPYCICEGAVPGTEVRGVLSVENFESCNLNKPSSFTVNDLQAVILRWGSQQKHNNQLNLYKFKRLKLFLVLAGKIDSLHEKTIDEFIAILSGDEIYSMLASFGEDARQVNYEHCPHCGGGLHSLVNSMSQPFCGYLPSSRPLYHECETCGLVIQSPSIHEDDVHKIYDKWDKEDFVASTNNPYTTESIRCDLTNVIPFLPSAAKTLDLGGGVGNFSKFLSAQYPDWNITHSDFEIKANVAGDINSCALDFTKEPIGDEQYNLITAWEVIEHVPFHKLSFVLQNIWRALTPGGFFIFSTPDYDSPLCKSFDFYALCPPFHYMVYGEKWLKKYFADSREFEIFDVKHCSDFLDDALNWYSYGSKTCPSMALRNTSTVLQSIFELDSDQRIRNRLAAAGIGTEIVMALRKKPH